MDIEKNKKWDLRFLNLALEVSKWSKDPSTKVGAIIVDREDRIVSVGYNGFAKGVLDSEERLNNRDIKYKLVCHAEMNAILFAKRDLTDCILYTFPFGCCSNCASYVIQTGISRVVFPKTDNPRWTESIALSKQIWDEAGILWDEVDFCIGKTAAEMAYNSIIAFQSHV
jgi:dCMP deaminase